MSQYEYSTRFLNHLRKYKLIDAEWSDLCVRTVTMLCASSASEWGFSLVETQSKENMHFDTLRYRTQLAANQGLFYHDNVFDQN